MITMPTTRNLITPLCNTSSDLGFPDANCAMTQVGFCCIWFKAGPLELSLWSFLAFFHHGMENEEGHLA